MATLFNMVHMPRWMRRCALDAGRKVSRTKFSDDGVVNVPFIKPQLAWMDSASGATAIAYGKFTFYQNGHLIQAECPDDFLTEIDLPEDFT